MPSKRPAEDNGIAPLLSWLRDCLAEDRSGRGVTNIFSQSVKARRFLDGEDRTTGTPTWLADLPPGQARILAESVDIYRRECGFYLGTPFLAGRIAGREIAAPVLLFPVEDGGPQGGTFVINAAGWRFNPALAALIGAPDDWEIVWSPKIDALLEAGGAARVAAEAVAAASPGLDTPPFLHGASLAKPADLKEAAKGAPRLVPAAALLLAERSANVRGVIDEIGRIVVGGIGAASPLAALFGKAAHPRTPKGKCRVEQVPALLSEAQEALVKAAATEAIAICHGPPGTGKTFTLAAAAVEHAARGESVLVVCRSAKAADVMERSIVRLAGDDSLTLRTGSRAAVRKLRSRLDLLNFGADRTSGDPHHARRRRELDRVLRSLDRMTRDFARGLAAAERKGRWFDPAGAEEWWHGLRRRLDQAWPGKPPLLMTAAGRLADLQRERIAAAEASLLSARRHRLDAWLQRQDVRETLRRYREALGSRTSGAWEREIASIHPGFLVSLFPVWIVESDDLHRVLPLAEGMFDLTMIDEASQCDSSSAIPALFRGRRALIAGDPQQLRHVSFLSENRLAALAGRHGIPAETLGRFHYRRKSLIDVALDAGGSVHFLSEHFRSRPELIAFSNERFYSRRLRLMRELPEPGEIRPAALIRTVAGERDAAGVNRRELEEAARFLGKWLEETAASGVKRSIGFLSPFRAQVDAFEPILAECLGREALGRLIHEHDLIVATAHGFQGDERDTMLLSLALTGNCPAGARRFLEREDVFNVSITRARDEIVVFHSLGSHRRPGSSLLDAWLASLEKERRRKTDAGLCRWIAEVAEALPAHGLRCETGLSAGGIPLDLLVHGRSGGHLALDLVGQRGRAGESVSLREQLLLQRTGLRLLPLGIHEWRNDRERCIQAILEALHGM